MDADNLKRILQPLLAARNIWEAGNVIRGNPALLDPQVDALLTQMLHEDLAVCDAYLAARAFLAQFRAGERRLGDRRFPSLPLARACHLHDLADENCRASLAEYRRWTEQALSLLRADTDQDIQGVAWYLLGQRLAGSSSGPGARANLLEAETCVEKASAIFQHLPDQAAAWKECLHLLDEIWTTYAWLDPRSNFDPIIDKYQKLLEEPLWDQEPYEKARLLHSLASLYYRHPGAHPPEFADHGIGCLIQALILLGNQQDGEFAPNLAGSGDPEHRQQSARSLSQLGNAYINRKRGEQLENIQLAIYYYRQALKAADSLDPAARQETAEDRADTLYNLSIAFGNRAVKTKKDREENLAEGINSGNAALNILRSIQGAELKQAKADDWLGVLCCRYQDADGKIPGEKLKQAVEHFESALALLKPAQNPFEWGNVQTHLGNAYYERARLSSLKAVPDLKEALKHYQEALKVHTQKSYPERWANIQNNLGAVYSALNMPGLARKSFQSTIAMGTAGGVLYEDVRRAALNQGNMEFFAQNWQAAADAYAIALEAGEILYRASLTEPGKKAELSENVALYQRAAYAMAQLGNADRQAVCDHSPVCDHTPAWDRALVWLEMGKTRILDELIQLQRAEARPENVPDALWEKFQDAKTRVQTSQVEMQKMDGDALAFTRRIAEQEDALQAFNAVVSSIQNTARDFLHAETFPEIRSLIHGAETALVAFCVTEMGSCAFILDNRSEHAQAVSLDPFDWASLRRLLDGSHPIDGSHPLKGGRLPDGGRPLDGYRPPSGAPSGSPGEAVQQAGWKLVCEKLGERRLLPAESLGYQERMEALLAEVGAALVQPVLPHLHPGIRKLSILPTGGLFLIPFHAAPVTDAARLGDLYQVSYVPSFKILAENRARLAAAPACGLYSVANTGEYFANRSLALDFVEVMEHEIKSSLPDAGARGWSIRLDRAERVKKADIFANARGSQALNLYCHGRFAPEDPMQSGLQITYEKQPLTPAELRSEKVRLDSVRLLTLIACESGIPDTVELPEEYISLPASFMQAGIPCVVSALWKVPEEATALLIGYFYQHLLTRGGDPAEAMQAAQQSLRSVTYSTLHRHTAFLRLKNPSALLFNAACAEKAQTDPDGCPFAHPFYWAAFSVNGAASDAEKAVPQLAAH